MDARAPRLTQGRLAVISAVFGLFVLFDICLFGWLLLKSLSQRELDKVVSEMRRDAEPVAGAIAQEALTLGKEDLYLVITAAQETRTYIQSVLSQRDIVRRIEVRDREGKVIYAHSNAETLPAQPQIQQPQVQTGSNRDNLPGPTLEDTTLEQQIPIGDLGSLVIGLRQEEVQKRIALLRRDLIRQISLISVLTVGLIAFAYAAIWFLFRRAQRLEEQALEAERMAYIGTLASGLAHEIRNPLNSLNLNLQMLQEEARERGESSAKNRLFAITRSELNRLERLVTDFLSYAKPRPLELQEIPLSELFDRVLQIMGSEIQARHAQVILEDQSAGLKVRVDPNQFGQLLINLLQNALASTVDTGRAPLLRLVARRQNTSAILEVIDNGCGIAEVDRAKIFDLFYSTRKGGTGLGLAIVQRIAKDHQIKIEVESMVGKGTTFRLRLPSGEPRESLTGQFFTLEASSKGQTVDPATAKSV